MRHNRVAMKTDDPLSHLSYTETEVRSFLPTGWSLADAADAAGAWDARKKVWRTTVIDNVDFDWPLVVAAGDASSLGRLEALRRAFDRVFRERLG